MIPVIPSERPPLEFDFEKGERSQKFNMSATKIGWLHTLSDQPGAKFDVTIRDALGRIRLQRVGFGTEHEKAGELLNMDTLLGEELEIEISNPQNVKKLQVFVN